MFVCIVGVDIFFFFDLCERIFYLICIFKVEKYSLLLNYIIVKMLDFY